MLVPTARLTLLLLAALDFLGGDGAFRARSDDELVRRVYRGGVLGRWLGLVVVHDLKLG